jgi:hypothetical protein
VDDSGENLLPGLHAHRIVDLANLAHLAEADFLPGQLPPLQTDLGLRFQRKWRGPLFLLQPRDGLDLFDLNPRSSFLSFLFGLPLFLFLLLDPLFLFFLFGLPLLLSFWFQFALRGGVLLDSNDGYFLLALLLFELLYLPLLLLKSKVGVGKHLLDRRKRLPRWSAHRLVLLRLKNTLVGFQIQRIGDSPVLN